MKVLITGAAGLFGGIVREHWGSRYAPRLADIRPAENLAPHDEYVEPDSRAARGDSPRPGDTH